MNEKIDIAIIFPVFNPHQDWDQNILQTSLELQKTFPKKLIQYIIVNDGSSRQVSFDVFINNPNFYFITHGKNIGKGASVRTGIKSVEADLYLYTDYDIPFGTESIISMIQTFEKESAEVVISKRSEEYFRILPIGRKIISKSFMLINFFLFKGKITDTQGGLKGYRTPATKILLQGSQNGFLFETESLLAMVKAGIRFSIIEVSPKKGLEINNLHIKNILKNFLELFRVVFLK